jgi:hypothetical protein
MACRSIARETLTLERRRKSTSVRDEEENDDSIHKDWDGNDYPDKYDDEDDAAAVV